MDSLWRIELLGGLRAESDGRGLARFPTRKTAALLAYLAFHAERPQSREILIQLLWPESGPEAGRNSLSVALSALRRVLEAPCTGVRQVLRSDRQSVQLDPRAVATDVGEFEALLCAASAADSTAEEARLLQSAVGRYGGPLLRGYSEDWIYAEQVRLNGLLFGALRRLIVLAESSGDSERAVEYARAAVAADPLREEAHGELIRLLSAAGQAAAALRQYHELERSLRQELRIGPSLEIRSFVERLRGELAAPDPEAGHGVPGPSVTRDDARCSCIRIPAPLDRFFGRQKELTEIQEELRWGRTRLLTLTGPPGSGKTRLALQAVRRLQGEPRGGPWFVPLADLTDSRQLPALIRRVLLPGATGDAPLEQVVAVLSRGPAVLVLDNFAKHFTEGRPVVLELLQRLPQLVCLVTSRRRLELSGEHELIVGPLSTPALSSDPEALSRCASVQLFVDRARGAQPDFQLTAENSESVAELCIRLEGIPLAIELAAERARILTPRQLVPELAHRLDFLVSHRPDLEARHRSLRSALDWSYQLLQPDLQCFFAQLSVFRGGWSLEAAEAVVGSGQEGAPGQVARTAGADASGLCPRWTVVGALDELRTSSLIMSEDCGQAKRYRMLETLREYAASRVESATEPLLRQRHAEYFLQLAERASSHLADGDAAVWLDRLEAERDNLRAAREWTTGLSVGSAGSAVIPRRLPEESAGVCLHKGTCQSSIR